ncbi:MAG TPA: retropepsin-like aspartic protease [Acetobacteraceae bacterium]|nr:retropepsin-like aspartic protease [Acetobacteraceae bacterium]
MTRRHRLVPGLLLTLLALLGGCATQPYCKLLPLAEMPVEDYRNLLVVPAEINGQPVRLLVDTGAERTMLTETAVQRLRLGRDSHQTRSLGIGGVSAHFDARVPGIWLGGTRFPVERVAVGAFALPELPGGPVDGLLGADILLAFDLDLNIPGQRLTLYRVRRCPTAVPPWPALEVAGVGARRDRMLVPITVNGVAGKAVLDTGAQTSAISLEMAERTGVSPATLNRDPKITVHGAAPAPVQVPIQRFSRMTIAGEPVLYPRLAVVPTMGGLGDGLVGADFIRGRRLWLAFPTGQMFIAAGPAP